MTLPDDSTTPAADEAVQPTQVPVTKAAAKPMPQAQCLAKLTELFPALFTGPVKPLKLRIQADIQERAPGVFTKADLSSFFRRYTGATSYLAAVSRGQQRFDLDGQPAGELTAEHRQVAADELQRRRSVQNEQREQEEAGRRERYQLLRDFETTRLTEANFCALKGIAPDALPALLAQAREEAKAMPPRPANDHQRRDHRRDNRGPGGRPPQGKPGAPGPRQR
jgi:ProP effector